MDGVLSKEEEEQSSPAAQLDGEVLSSGEKRSVENGGIEGELEERPSKRPKTGPGTNAVLKRVAEIVLVLSTMSKIRGGKKPTETEIGLMAEARAKLVELCEGLAPKDIVARDAIGAVIEDLRLNGKVKDQKLGFNGPKLTIAERILQNKKKMEESRKYTPESSAHTSHSLQTNFNKSAENRGSSNTMRIVPSDKSTHALHTSRSIIAPSPPGQVSATVPTTIQYQLPTSEVKASSISSGLPSGHLARDSSLSTFPRVERPQFKSDGGPNGSTYASQGKVYSSGNHQLMHAPTWSTQTQSARSGSEQNKLPNHASCKVEGTAEMGMPLGTLLAPRDQSCRTFISQTTPGNLPNVHQPLHAMNYIHAPSLSNNHNEIAKVVQKILQPKKPDHPTWIPPSRDYMNKALTCHLCQLMINEVDTVLICDACEKGYHIKCMQSMNQRGIPRGEWHCSRCLALSNGKSLPPKYGRVMRSNTLAKVPSSSASVQSSMEKKVGIVDPNVNQQNITANGSSDLQSSGHTVGKGGNNIGLQSDSQNPSAREVQTDNFLSNPSTAEMQTFTISPNPNAGEMEPNKFISNPDAGEFRMDDFSLSANNINEKTFLGSCSNTSVNFMGEASGPHGASSSEISHDTENHESSTCKDESLEPKAITFTNESDSVTYKADDLQSSHDQLIGDQSGPTNSTKVTSRKFQENRYNATEKNPDKSHLGESSECSLRYDIKREDHNGAQKNTAASSDTSTGVLEHPGHSLYGLRDVEWIGDVVQDVDGKCFYESCCVDGVTYKLQDHALFRSSHEKLTPSKLQSMWEDSKTGSKWVIVNSCYFPGDLPENVGRPSPPERSEVYESNHNSTVMAGLIQGQCEVLHPTKFQEESERRSQSEFGYNRGLRPIFLCKWLYDEFKGSFQPVYS